MSWKWLMVPFLLLMTWPAVAREIGSFDRTLNVSGPVDLDVQTGSGTITVRAGGAGQVRVHATISASAFWSFGDEERRAREVQANPPIHQTGNSIRIERVADGWMWNGLSISYDVVVPAETKLRARTGSGGESVEGIRGPVDATTGSGRIRISRIEQDANARTGSGTIELDAVRGRVDAHTGSGSIRIAEVNGAVAAHTGSGHIGLRIRPDLGFELHAHTGSGGVTVNPPLTTQSSYERRHDVRGRIRGGGPMLELSTGSGGIRIE